MNHSKSQFRQMIAESEFEKFRVKQDQLYTSDFDRFLQLEEQVKKEK